jgi:hypothetical protein
VLDAAARVREGDGVNRRAMPSPAALVAMIALVLAVAGTAVATPGPFEKLSKAKVKRIADKRISKAAPGLSVADSAALGGRPASAFTPEPERIVGESGQPQFTNGWSNYGSGWGVAAFYKDPFDVVHLRGMIGSSSPDTSAFTLPEGYRPPQDLQFASRGIGGDSLSKFASVTINADGTVIPGCVGSNCARITLSGITFRAAP